MMMKRQTIIVLFMLPIISVLMVVGGVFVGMLATMIGADAGTEIIRVLGK